MSSYDERLAGLLAIGMPRRVAMVVAFRPELVAELGQAANIAMNPAGEVILPELAARQGLEKPKKQQWSCKRC